MADDLHVNDIGTVIEIILKDNGVAVDISTATFVGFYFQLPDSLKTVITRTPTFVTNGIDGKLHYTTVDGDLSIKGTWKVQAKVTLPTWNGRSAVGTFKVLANLS